MDVFTLLTRLAGLTTEFMTANAPKETIRSAAQARELHILKILFASISLSLFLKENNISKTRNEPYNPNNILANQTL